MKKMPLQIPLPHYERIFRVIHTLYVASQGKGDKPNCSFYNYAATAILEKFYKLEAAAVCGAAFIRLAEEPIPVLGLGRVNEASRTCSSDGEAFHCWVRTRDHFMDFTAPLYGQYMAPMGDNAPRVAQKMFQKHLSAVALSPWHVSQPGHFYFEPNRELTFEIVGNFNARPEVLDLVRRCLDWYETPPKQMSSPPLIGDRNGGARPVELYKRPLVGAW